MTALYSCLPLFATLALGLAACSSGEPNSGSPPLEGAALGGDFTLTGETGAPVSFSDFEGQYRTIYFGYTFCPDVCPVDVQRAMGGLAPGDYGVVPRGSCITFKPVQCAMKAH